MLDKAFWVKRQGKKNRGSTTFQQFIGKKINNLATNMKTELT